MEKKGLREQRVGETLGEVAGEGRAGEGVVDDVPSSQRRNSNGSMASGFSANSRSRVKPEMDRTLAFEKQKPDGPMRDKVTVDIFKIGDQQFKGTIKLKEAKTKIYKEAMGLPRDNLHAIEIEFRGHPVITYRLKKQINVDQTFESDLVTFTRDSPDGLVQIQGKIRGLRLGPGQETFIRGDSKRIKIKNCKWSLDEKILENWLGFFGELLSPIREEMHHESDDEDDDDEDEVDQPPLGTGNLWVNMRLERTIPQFLPIMGRKIEIYYRGINMTCNKCYEEGHRRSDCQSDKVEWLDYVKNFIESNEQIEPAMFGKWFEIVATRATERVAEQQQLYKRSVGGYEPEVILVEQSGSKKPVDQVRAVVDQTTSYRNSESYRRNVNQDRTSAAGKQTTQRRVVTIQSPSKGESDRPTVTVGEFSERFSEHGAQCDQTSVLDPVVESQAAVGIGVAPVSLVGEQVGSDPVVESRTAVAIGIAPASLAGAQVGEVVRTRARARRTESLDRGMKKGWTQNAEGKSNGK